MNINQTHNKERKKNCTKGIFSLLKFNNSKFEIKLRIDLLKMYEFFKLS